MYLCIVKKGTMEFERRAPKIISQAWKNLLPAQSVKIGRQKSTSEKY